MELENEVFFCGRHIMHYTTSRADSGFFLAGVAPLRNDVNLVSCFFLLLLFFSSQNTSYFRKLQVMSGMGSVHPLHPSPRSTPEH